jgi:hypothetical protein
MSWKFDQAPCVVCITCQSVIDGHPVLLATHYEEDHSWAFLDGAPFDLATALVVAMSEVAKRHPDIVEVACLPPGWTATRAAVGEPWSKQQDDWEAEA